MILGVTGVMGSGKSTFCEYLERKHGFHWIHADKVVHELYLEGNPGYRKIREYFGENFVGKKEVLRSRLRKFVLKTPQKIWILNKLIHPLVSHEVNKKIVQLKRQAKAKKADLKICIEAIYFESNDLGKFIDQLVVIEASDAVIMRRLKSRKIPDSELATLIKFQRKNLIRSGIRIKNDTSLRKFYEEIQLHAVAPMSALVWERRF